MKRLSSSGSTTIRRKYALLCAVLFAPAAFFLTVSSFHNLFLGGHGVFYLHLVKELHIENRLFAESPPPILATRRRPSRNIMTASTLDPANNGSIMIVRKAAQPDDHERDQSSFMQEGCRKSKALLKVYMYDLPSELHFGMIDPKNVKEGHVWPSNLTDVVNYPGGLNQQHSPEYWLTLDLLNSLEGEDEERDDESELKARKPYEDASTVKERQANGKSKLKMNSTDVRHHQKGHQRDPLFVEVGARRQCTAVRVRRPKDADVIFVPFFASLSYNKYGRMRMKNRDLELQKKVVDYVVNQKAWKRSKGRDHVIVMHHPNSLHMARALLGEATFIVADFGRPSSKVSHLGKDIVAPYKHMIPTFIGDHTSFESRPTLLFFQGAIHRKQGGYIREKLYNLLKDEKGVIFKDASVSSASLKSATKGMRSSKFCLHLAGDTPSSNRLFDAIVSHCVPVIISKDIELPYEDILDYSKFCIFVNHEDAMKRGYLVDFLKSIGRDEWSRLWRRLQEVEKHFEYQFPSEENDATQMVWRSLAHKLPSIHLKVHKLQRYYRSHHL